MKPFVAKWSAIHGPLNPKNIWSAKYLVLASALQRGDHPDNVKQALFDWLGEKNFSQAQVVGLLDMPPDEAINTILQKFGAGLDPERVPQNVRDTLRKTLGYIAGEVRQRRRGEIRSELVRMRQIHKKYTPEGLAAYLLGTDY